MYSTFFCIHSIELYPFGRGGQKIAEHPFVALSKVRPFTDRKDDEKIILIQELILEVNNFSKNNFRTASRCF